MFINVLKLYQYKAKNSETKPYPFYLENIFKIFPANNIKKEKKTGSNKYAYNFSVDYDIIDTSIIISIQVYLMKKKWHKITFRFVIPIFITLLSSLINVLAIQYVYPEVIKNAKFNLILLPYMLINTIKNYTTIYSGLN